MHARPLTMNFLNKVQHINIFIPQITAYKSRGQFPSNQCRSASIQSIESNELDFNEYNIRRDSAELS